MPQEQHRATSRILDLLELLSGANGAGYTLTELSQALHIPKSSLFSIIHTLEERRYVHCDKHSGQYSIGISAYVLGTSFPAEQSLAVLHRVMEEVVARCRETCQLGVLDQGNILYLEKVDSPQAIRLISRVGDRLPANATALGKALLSGLSDEEVRTLYAAGLPRLTSHTVTELPQLLDQLAQIRSGGLAAEREECAAAERPRLCRPQRLRTAVSLHRRQRNTGMPLPAGRPGGAGAAGRGPGILFAGVSANNPVISAIDLWDSTWYDFNANLSTHGPFLCGPSEKGEHQWNAANTFWKDWAISITAPRSSPWALPPRTSSVP